VAYGPRYRDRPRHRGAAAQLRTHGPDRNRKPLEANPLAPWELRIGKLRVYFDVENEPTRVVMIRAVGIKERNCVRIGVEEIELR
jgi:mRNA-degrading endonuclease RelE of RelBE toxin-antitoxin system